MLMGKYTIIADTGRHYKMYKYMRGEYYSELMNRMLLQKYNDTHLNADS